MRAHRFGPRAIDFAAIMPQNLFLDASRGSVVNSQLILLELNEVNLEYVQRYCEQGLLPNFRTVLERHGWSTTTSEQRYEHLEPWIQWVTAHTGKSLQDHGVFRLGDIVHHDIPQIWEQLESFGLRVGAISPMNAKHRLRAPAFFVPDPWTTTKLTARPTLKKLYTAIAQAVNENAQSRLTASSLWHLFAGYLAYAKPTNYAEHFRLVAGSRVAPWRRAIFLDSLLADAFITETKRTEPNFASLFLNAAAHIQHHYLFSSNCYGGPLRNPEWYVDKNTDPVREVYETYDRILADIRSEFPEARLMIATGLHQDPHGSLTYYWRLRNHAMFLRKIGLRFQNVAPRMSRDFLVMCDSEEMASIAEQRLRLARSTDGSPLFEVDNRGCDLFVMLIYPREISRDFSFWIGNERFDNFHEDVAFVAIKNGQHNGIGYFVDTAISSATNARTEFPLSDLPQRILEAFGIPSTLSKDISETDRPRPFDEHQKHRPPAAVSA